MKRIDARFFPKEQEEIDLREREEFRNKLDQSILGSKSSSEIRKILRHKKKYETEL